MDCNCEGYIGRVYRVISEAYPSTARSRITSSLILCILLFYDFCCLRSSFGSISSWINDIQSKKRTNLLIYRPKWKFTLPFVFVHKMIFFFFTFWVDLWSQKVTWLRNGRSDFRKLGVKICARLQRKKSWSGAAESAAVLRFCVVSEAPPPPPPVQLGLMQWPVAT